MTIQEISGWSLLALLAVALARKAYIEHKRTLKDVDAATPIVKRLPEYIVRGGIKYRFEWYWNSRQKTYVMGYFTPEGDEIVSSNGLTITAAAQALEEAIKFIKSEKTQEIQTD